MGGSVCWSNEWGCEMKWLMIGLSKYSGVVMVF